MDHGLLAIGMQLIRLLVLARAYQPVNNIFLSQQTSTSRTYQPRDQSANMSMGSLHQMQSLFLHYCSMYYSLVGSVPICFFHLPWSYVHQCMVAEFYPCSCSSHPSARCQHQGPGATHKLCLQSTAYPHFFFSKREVLLIHQLFGDGFCG